MDVVQISRSSFTQICFWNLTWVINVSWKNKSFEILLIKYFSHAIIFIWHYSWVNTWRIWIKPLCQSYWIFRRISNSNDFSLSLLLCFKNVCHFIDQKSPMFIRYWGNFWNESSWEIRLNSSSCLVVRWSKMLFKHLCSFSKLLVFQCRLQICKLFVHYLNELVLLLLNRAQNNLSFSFEWRLLQI